MAPEPWPADELEAVDCCPLCGCAERTMLHRDLTDRVFFCAPGGWHLYRCRGCEGAYLDPRPTSESIARAYSSYYTHELEGGGDAPQLPSDVSSEQRITATSMRNTTST
jgi:hypothetical protein